MTVANPVTLSTNASCKSRAVRSAIVVMGAKVMQSGEKLIRLCSIAAAASLLACTPVNHVEGPTQLLRRPTV